MLRGGRTSASGRFPLSRAWELQSREGFDADGGLVSDPTQTGVYLSGSDFILAGISGYSGPLGGTADFSIGGAIDSNDNTPVFTAKKSVLTAWEKILIQILEELSLPAHMESNKISGGSFVFGEYGFDISSLNGASSKGGSAVVPESGQVAASLLLLTGIGGYVFLKCRKPQRPRSSRRLPDTVGKIFKKTLAQHRGGLRSHLSKRAACLSGRRCG